MTDSNETEDARGELDKGAFDAVSRATTNHGLHRGSFQCDAVITADNGQNYPVSYWEQDKDKNQSFIRQMVRRLDMQRSSDAFGCFNNKTCKLHSDWN